MPTDTDTVVKAYIDGKEAQILDVTNTFEVDTKDSEYKQFVKYSMPILNPTGSITFRPSRELKKFFKRLRFPKKQRRRNNRLFRKRARV